MASKAIILVWSDPNTERVSGYHDTDCRWSSSVWPHQSNCVGNCIFMPHHTPGPLSRHHTPGPLSRHPQPAAWTMLLHLQHNFRPTHLPVQPDTTNKAPVLSVSWWETSSNGFQWRGTRECLRCQFLNIWHFPRTVMYLCAIFMEVWATVYQVLLPKC